MNSPNEHSDEQHPIRKLLKGLPEVQARPDFESRLQRRINEGSRMGEREGWLNRLFASKPIPVFAYSVATLLLVGFVSYFAFFRSGVAPVPERPALYESKKQLPEANMKSDKAEFRDGKVSGDSHISSEEAPQGVATEANAPHNDELDDRQHVNENLRKETGAATADRESAPNQPKDNKIAKTWASPTVSNESRTRTGEEKEAVEQMKSKKEQSASGSVQQAPPQSPQEGKTLYAPLVPQSAKSLDYKLQAQQNSIAIEVDSITRRDSLKADSILRVQKQLQKQQLRQQQRGKSKRSGEKD